MPYIASPTSVGVSSAAATPLSESAPAFPAPAGKTDKVAKEALAITASHFKPASDWWADPSGLERIRDIREAQEAIKILRAGWDEINENSEIPDEDKEYARQILNAHILAQMALCTGLSTEDGNLEIAWRLALFRMQILEDTEIFVEKDGTEIPRFVVDPLTEDRYFNESKWVIRGKGLALVFGTVIQLFKGIENLCKRLAAISYGDRPLKQLLHIALIIPIIAALFFAACYTVFDPYNGRKLYATLERCLWDGIEEQKRISFLAPCFQPYNLGSFTPHLFGGAASLRNAF